MVPNKPPAKFVVVVAVVAEVAFPVTFPVRFPVNLVAVTSPFKSTVILSVQVGEVPLLQVCNFKRLPAVEFERAAT